MKTPVIVERLVERPHPIAAVPAAGQMGTDLGRLRRGEILVDEAQ
jgi:hypothetical protein